MNEHMPKYIPASLKQWMQQVGEHTGMLTHSQIQTLAQFSYAVAMTQEAGQTTAATLMSELLDRKFNTVRQRFREFTYESAAKRSAGVRREVDVSQCFAEVFDWVASISDESDPLVLALDASNLRDRFTVLAISVVYSGTAIPVAWHIQDADEEGEWNLVWDWLLDHLSGVIPAERPVYALTDRGLQSPWLFRRLQRIGWHPVMRIREQGFFYPESKQTSFDLATWASKDMTPQQVKGVAFASEIRAILVGSWDDEAGEPLLLLTDCDLDGQQT